MELLQKIYNKVIVDGQAYLYAEILRLRAESKGEVVDETTFAKWQDEYKEQTAALVKEVIQDGKTDDNS